MLILCTLTIVALLFLYMQQIPPRKTNRMVFLLFRHLEQHIIHFCKDKTILKFHDGNSSIQMVFPKEQHLYPVHNELPYALIAPIQTKN